MKDSITQTEVSCVKVGHLEIEGLMDADGNSAIALPQICELFQIRSKNASRYIKDLMGKDFQFLKVRVPWANAHINAITEKDIERLIHVLATSKNPVAYEMIHGKLLRKSTKALERSIQLALQEKLGGEIEVKCLAGKIDLLTPLEIIEVKKVSDWKSALGQVLVYGHYYPSHQKRLHLFGTTQESFIEFIRSHCTEFEVTVTWQQG